jgi:sortase A
VIVEGVSVADLRVGPGHYPGTALPGQVGNFAVAGHRATHGNGFMRLNELVPGDLVVVEVQDAWLTYRVTGHEVVDPSDVSVIAPVPGDPGVPPTQPLITLTTCDPWYSAAHRLIVHGKLQSVTPKSAGLPAALAGG